MIYDNGMYLKQWESSEKEKKMEGFSVNLKW